MSLQYLGDESESSCRSLTRVRGMQAEKFRRENGGGEIAQKQKTADGKVAHVLKTRRFSSY